MLSYYVKFNREKDCHVVLVTETLYDESYIVASYEASTENEACQWGDNFINSKYEEKLCQV